MNYRELAQQAEDEEQQAYLHRWALEHPRREWHFNNFTWFAIITLALSVAALIWGEK